MSSCDNISLWFLISWLVPCTDWSAFLSSNFLYCYLTSKVLMLFFLTRNSCLLHTLYFPLQEIFHGRYIYKINWSSHKHVHGIYYYKTLCVIYLLLLSFYFHGILVVTHIYLQTCLCLLLLEDVFFIKWGREKDKKISQGEGQRKPSFKQHLTTFNHIYEGFQETKPSFQYYGCNTTIIYLNSYLHNRSGQKYFTDNISQQILAWVKLSILLTILLKLAGSHLTSSHRCWK